MASDGHLRRFLHLERARPAGPTAEPARDGPTRPRSGSPGWSGPGRRRPGRCDRSPAPGSSASAPSRSPPSSSSRPRVAARSSAAAAAAWTTTSSPPTCQGCGLGLDTPEQREFDERFWAARAAEGEQEARAAAERQELRDRAEAEEAHARRAMGEAIAREVGESERHRLDGWWGPRTAPSPAGRPSGCAWRAIYLDQRWHLPAFLGAVLLGLVLAIYGYVRAQHGRSWAGVRARPGPRPESPTEALLSGPAARCRPPEGSGRRPSHHTFRFR